MSTYILYMRETERERGSWVGFRSMLERLEGNEITINMYAACV